MTQLPSKSNGISPYDSLLSALYLVGYQMIPCSISDTISPNDSLLSVLYLAGYQIIPYSISNRISSKDNLPSALYLVGYQMIPCSISNRISPIIIHQSILYELLSNLIGSLSLYYDFILHWFTFYGAFKLLILHGFTFFGGFDWFVSSSWPTAVLQVDASQLTLLAVCCIWWVQIKKFVHTNSGRNSAEVSTTFELICLRLQASLIFVVFPRSASVGAC